MILFPKGDKSQAPKHESLKEETCEKIIWKQPGYNERTSESKWLQDLPQPNDLANC